MSGMFFKNSSQPAKGEAYTYIPLLADESEIFLAGPCVIKTFLTFH